MATELLRAMGMGTYRVLEDVALADAAFEVAGEDLDDVFATAARALAELAVDPDTLDSGAERRLELETDALDLLLYDWLAELIYLKDRHLEVYPETEVRVTPGPRPRLTAWLRGGRIARGRTTLRADAKAITLHRFALEPADGGGWRARFVVDV